jgi:hypothetical protein
MVSADIQFLVDVRSRYLIFVPISFDVDMEVGRDHGH